MEGFCLDIQRLILKEICGPSLRVCSLWAMVRVNKTLRNWVIRFVLDNTTTPMVEKLLARRFDCLERLVHEWGVVNVLYTQLENQPSLKTSCIMFLDSYRRPMYFEGGPKGVYITEAYHLFGFFDSIYHHLRTTTELYDRLNGFNCITGETDYFRIQRQKTMDGIREEIVRTEKKYKKE